MSSDSELIPALEAVVDGAPHNQVIRLHLAGLLIEADRPQDAITHLEIVLGKDPDHSEALGLAARAGALCGDSRTAGWSRLRDLVVGPAAGDSKGGLEGLELGRTQSESASKRSDETDWDQFLRDVLNEPGGRDRVTLADVGGLRDVKERLERSFFTPLRNPDLRRAYGAQLRGGLLLWGPPGCGKTFLARAVAGQLEARFVNIGLHQILDMWLGNSEKQLHNLFEHARHNAPCVLFFDELDAIGHTRTNLGRSAARNVVAQLLVELDGVDSSNEGIFVIGATNQPWAVDPALRRPGRFDRSLLILPPDAAARGEILRYHLRDRPVASIDFDALAVLSEGLSGSDLRLVCDEAAQHALGEAIASSVVVPITTNHMRDAVAEIRPSTLAWFDSARNHVRYANDSGEYDELAAYLRQHRSR